jgi:hypothetical protein
VIEIPLQSHRYVPTNGVASIILCRQDNHEQGVRDAARNGVLEIQDGVVETEKKRSETIPIISNTGADDFDSRDTTKETSVEIVNEAADDTSSTTGSSSVKQLHETTDLWSLNPEGHYATVDTVPDDSISRTNTSNSSEGMLLDKLFGKATPASVDDGTASADLLVEVGHAISVLITSPQSTITWLIDISYGTWQQPCY